MAILERLRNLLHRPRETESQEETPIFSEEMIQAAYGIHRDYELPMSEIIQNPNGPHFAAQRFGMGGICNARVESDRPVHIGELLVVNERGGVRPIGFEEMETIVNNPQNTVVACMQESNGNDIVQVRVQQGSLGLITGETPGTVFEAEQMAEAIEAARVISGTLQPVVNTLIDAVQPVMETLMEAVQPIAETIEHILDGCNTIIHTDSLKNKYDERYPHKCYKCKRDLQYIHALQKAKQKNFSEEQFKKMWKSTAVEFYCCFCIPDKSRIRRPWAISTPHPDAGREVLNRMSEAAFRWGPGHPHHLLNNHRITGFHLENEQGEVIYQDELPDPVFTHELTHEVLEPHQRHALQFDVRVRGGEGLYFNGTFNRSLLSPIQSEHQNITIGQEFLDVTEQHKITAIGQILMAWVRLTPRIRINERHPEIVEAFIQRIIHNPEYIIDYYDRVVREFTNAFQQWITQEMRAAIGDYRERVLWRGYNIRQRYNQVHLHGGIVDGVRIEAVAENQDDQRLNGLIAFVDHLPEIINPIDLEDRANAILLQSHRLTGAEVHERDYREMMGICADGIIYDEYNQNPVVPEISDCPHHEFNERGNCRACGITRVQLDMVRSTRLAEHHRMGTHTFEFINGEMLCRICRLSPVEIDAERNRQGLPGLTREELRRNAENYRNHLALSGDIRWSG